MAPHAFDLD